MSQIKENLEPRWYVVHTYSGYENKVKTDLEKTIDQNMFIENTYVVARRGKKNYYIGKAK